MDSKYNDELISQCFFIFDEVVYTDTESKEHAIPDDKMLVFFHPNNLETKVKIDLAKAICGINFFTGDFLKSDKIKILSMSKYKFALLQLSNLTLVVGGKLDESDSMLKQLLEDMYKAYTFYWGEIEEVVKLFKREQIENFSAYMDERERFLTKMKEHCSFMLPILYEFREEKLLKYGTYLPRFRFSPDNNQLSIEASKMITDLINDDIGIYAGCLFYDRLLICAHIDLEIARWISNKIRFLPVNDGSIYHEKVFLTNSQVEKIGGNGRFLTLSVIAENNCVLALIGSSDESYDLSKTRSNVGLLGQSLRCIHKKSKKQLPNNIYLLIKDNFSRVAKGNIPTDHKFLTDRKSIEFLQKVEYLTGIYNSRDVSKIILKNSNMFLYSCNTGESKIFYQCPAKTVKCEEDLENSLHEMITRKD